MENFLTCWINFQLYPLCAVINATIRHYDRIPREFRNISELKKNFCEEKGIFQSVSPLNAFRGTHNVYYIPAENVDTNNIRQKLDMPPQKKENERKDTRYNETKRRHDWKSVASGGPLWLMVTKSVRANWIIISTFVHGGWRAEGRACLLSPVTNQPSRIMDETRF